MVGRKEGDEVKSGNLSPGPVLPLFVTYQKNDAGSQFLCCFVYFLHQVHLENSSLCLIPNFNIYDSNVLVMIYFFSFSRDQVQLFLVKQNSLLGYVDNLLN